MQSKGRVATTAGVIVVIGAVVWACDAGEMVSDAMVGAADAMMDASATLRDGASAVRDGASNDAAAQDRVEMPACDVERTYRVETPASNRYTESTYWYAEVRDPALTPDTVSDVVVMRCDQENFPPAPPGPTPCPEGSTCTGEQPYNTRCSVGSGALIEDGVVRVNCGARFRSGTLDGSAPEGVSGYRWTSLRFTIR